MRDFDDIDIELARLGEATKGIAPRADFTNRVMQSIQAERGSPWLRAIRHAGLRSLPVAVMAAVISMAWAAHSDSDLDDVLAISYEATEAIW